MSDPLDQIVLREALAQSWRKYSPLKSPYSWARAIFFDHANDVFCRYLAFYTLVTSVTLIALNYYYWPQEMIWYVKANLGISIVQGIALVLDAIFVAFRPPWDGMIPDFISHLKQFRKFRSHYCAHKREYVLALRAVKRSLKEQRRSKYE